MILGQKNLNIIRNNDFAEDLRNNHFKLFFD